MQLGVFQDIRIQFLQRPVGFIVMFANKEICPQADIDVPRVAIGTLVPAASIHFRFPKMLRKLVCQWTVSPIYCTT